jgi:hypothetical protein
LNGEHRKKRPATPLFLSFFKARSNESKEMERISLKSTLEQRQYQFYSKQV